jgi:hypothetical protein
MVCGTIGSSRNNRLMKGLVLYLCACLFVACIALYLSK